MFLLLYTQGSVTQRFLLSFVHCVCKALASISNCSLSENNFFSRRLEMNPARGSSTNRKIIVIRHGERLDFTFGYSWIQENYVREDLNMPESLPPRDFNHWRNDTPLTVLGETLAQSVGSSLKAGGVKVSNVFVSPAYRCLQTAAGIVKGMGLEKEMPLSIESGLFEWTGFFNGRWPNLLTAVEAGDFFNIKQEYKPTVSRSELEECSKETIDEYYERSFRTTKELLKNCEGDVLIVAHGASLETCTRQLIGKEKRSRQFLLGDLIHKIPYLGAVALEQNQDSFKLVEPPCLTMTHDASKKSFVPNFVDLQAMAKNPVKRSLKFDWKILLEEPSTTE